MEGGQKQNISLESELDIKTSDMMSLITQPKFAHNRQQYQGHYLPSSLRFEHDGWAAGWDVYNFKFTGEKLPTSPEGYYIGYTKIGSNNYKFSIVEKVSNESYKEVGSILFCSNFSSINGVKCAISSGIVHITGSLNNHTYDIQWPVISPEDYVIISDGKLDGPLTCIVKHDKNKSNYVVYIEDTTTIIEDGISLMPVSKMKFSDTQLPFINLVDDIYTWSSKNVTISFNNNKLSLSCGNLTDEINVTPVNNKIVTNFIKKYVYQTNVRVKTNNYISSYSILDSLTSNIDMTHIDGKSDSSHSHDKIRIAISGSNITKQNGINVEARIPLWTGLSLNTAEHAVEKIETFDILECSDSWTKDNREYYLKAYYIYKHSDYKVYPKEWFNNTGYNTAYTESGYVLPSNNRTKAEWSTIIDSHKCKGTEYIRCDDTDDIELQSLEAYYIDSAGKRHDISNLKINFNYTDVTVPTSIDPELFMSTNPFSLGGMEQYIYTCKDGNINVYTLTAPGVAGRGCAKSLFGYTSTHVYIDDNYILQTELGPAKPSSIMLDRDDTDFINVTIAGTDIDKEKKTCKLNVLLNMNGLQLFKTARDSDSNLRTPQLPNSIWNGDTSYDIQGTDDSGMCLAIAPFVDTLKTKITTLDIVVATQVTWQRPSVYPHNYLSKDFEDVIKNFDIKIGDLLQDNTQILTVNYAGNTLTWRWNAVTKSLYSYTVSRTFDIHDVNVKWAMVPDIINNEKSTTDFTISHSFELLYNISAQLPYAAGYDIKSIINNIYSLLHNATGTPMSIELDNKLLYIKNKQYPLTLLTSGVYYTLYYYADSVQFSADIAAPYAAYNVLLRYFDDDIIAFEYNDVEYTFDYNRLLLSNAGLEFIYTDTRKSALIENIITDINVNNEYQFLKQQWDTTSNTENFWWIDSQHILLLNRTHLILRRKTDVLHDWDGDTFEDVNTWKRDIILHYLENGVLNNCIAYGCTNAYDGDTALFYCVHIVDGLVCLKFFNPLTDTIRQVTIPLVVHTIDSKLIDADNLLALNTYSDLTVSSLVNNAKYSSTCIDRYILFGIHYDNNFNQWTVKINRDLFNIEHVVQGYGFVGVNGCLTGGEIPVEYFDDYGFNSTVYNVDVLTDENKDCYEDVSQIYNIDIGECVIGNDTQQWYIAQKITGIVSHLTWQSDTKHWQVVKLPLNNNIKQLYKSSSFASRLLSNYIPYVQPLDSMFPKAMMDSGSAVATTIKIALTAAFVLAGAPMIYMIMPYLSLWNELQQSFGQYAYVHYNSTNIHQSKDMTKGNDDNVNNDKDDLRTGMIATAQDSDSIIFNVHTVPQTAEHLDPFMDLITTVMMYGFDVGELSKTIHMNEHTNITPASETGNSVSSPYYIYNKENLCASEMSTDGFTPTTNTKVTGCLSLDMFYSTCDQQKISAGPGWVNHNFVAQCTAQSITSHSMYLQQCALRFTLGFLTMIQLDAIYTGMKTAYEALADTMEVSENTQAFGSTVGAPAAIAASVARAILNVTMTMVEGCRSYLKDSILPALGDGSLQFIRPAKKETVTYDCERTHKYGSKSECFMWPCFDIPQNASIVDEVVDAEAINKSWKLSVPLSNNAAIDAVLPPITLGAPTLIGITSDAVSSELYNNWRGDCPYWIVNVKGVHNKVALPEDMAYVLGTESFLPGVAYRNENIGESEPVFATPPFQDYAIDKNWQLGQTSSAGMTTWLSCKDTKIIDGEYSNIVIDGVSFCGVACPYTAIEIKMGISKEYMRPYAITPNTLVLNNTGINCCYDEKAYHAFDGYGYRIINWVGVPGVNKEHQTFMYNFLVNNRFKRSNKLPLNEFLGNFKSDPVVAISGDNNDKPFLLVTQPGENKGLTSGTIGEDKDVRRYSIPVFSELVSTLPAVVKTIAAVNLSVIDGVTSLTTENRDLQTAYKAPLSIDFAIGKNLYRFTNEYICSLSGQKGVTVTQDIVPCLGLEFIGATPYEAYLYSPATKQYYSYSGGSSLSAVDMIERFRDVINGRYDFINQEVLVPCLATFNRIDSNVLDDADETDNVMVPRVKSNKFIGEIYPPINTIFNTRSWFKTLSMPMGIVYQGPNRCIINRFVYSEYMLEQIKSNYGLWQRVPKEKYNPFRRYKAIYETVDKSMGDYIQVKGWTHNPFLLVTAPLGVGEETDCMFEWEVTFCWPVEMDKLYGPKDYAVVNLQAETMTPGGKVVAARPTHVYLTKDLFTRTGNYGYYSFRYQSECGAGNRERLHIWSDQYICISGLQVEYKTVTGKRNEILTQQVDIQQMNEI